MKCYLLAFCQALFVWGEPRIPQLGTGENNSGTTPENDRQFHTSTKLWLIVWLTGASVAWGVVRSTLLKEGVPDSSGLVIPVWIRFLFMLLFALPVLRLARSIKGLLWLLGVSVTAGSLPSVPLMPYVRECAHLVFIVTALVIIARRNSCISELRCSLAVRLYLGYLGLCTLSIAANQFLGGTVWQLKVGVAEMILYLAFGLVIADLAARASSGNNFLTTIVDGFVWATLGQVIVVPVAFGLIMQSPLVPGNDTVFGIGYWDRMKSTFAGPDHAGVFFVASIPLLIWWASKQRGRIARAATLGYLQLAPWFLVATGSRTGRIAIIVTIGACVLQRTTRKLALVMLPSLALAFYVGFYFQSLPLAIWVLRNELSGGVSSVAELGLKGNFFLDVERSRLIGEALDAFRAGTAFNQLFGFGLGTAGYRTSGFPSPHMSSIDALIETGFLGMLFLGAFVLVLCVHLGRVSRTGTADEAERAFVVLAAVVATSLASFTYEVQTWGFVMVIYAMGIAASAPSARAGYLMKRKILEWK